MPGHSGEHQTGVARRDGHRHPRGNEHARPPRQQDRPSVRATQIRAGVAGLARRRGPPRSPSSRCSGTRSIAGHYRSGPRPGKGRPVASRRMLAWIDLEMTGLDPTRHTIVEIASLITDDDLAIVEEGPDLVVHATPEQLAEMDDFVLAMHTRSGLLDAIEALHAHLADAGAQTLDFLKQHIPEPRTVPLAGNSIGTDRRFLARQLPEIEDYLHYRSVDVSTVKELCRRWRPEIYKAAPSRRVGTAPCRTSARASKSSPTTATPSSSTAPHPRRRPPPTHRTRRPRPHRPRPPRPAPRPKRKVPDAERRPQHVHR